MLSIKRNMRSPVKYIMVIIITMISSCNQTKEKEFQMGSYGYDKSFFEENNIEFLELKSNDNQSKILVVPAYQGRVMTSTAGGDEGRSYGWINHSFIESGEKSPQFNVYGGEERFWLGPEGGPFSIYFEPGEEQAFENWRVPSLIDTESFDMVQSDEQSVKFTKEASIVNAHGTEFHIGIERTITLLSIKDVSAVLNTSIPSGLQVAAYETDNVITNRGGQQWTKENGLLSIWLLCMFNPSPATTVFIPYNPEGEGVVVNDDYFGKVPAERLIVDGNTIFFKADGKYRSKIGIPPGRAKELCGSYDSERKLLTLLWCSLPDEPLPYVNSAWGEQDDPYDGDVINSYNDGPVEDGSIMGPFYELESSSPAVELQPSESLRHVQRVMHFEGREEALATLVRSLFDLDLKEIANKF
jgi:hypothetical protein